MLSKVLISCALFVAAQARYAQSGYGSDYGSGSGGAQVGGYAAYAQPRVRVQVLPSASYGGAGAYGGSAGGYGGSAGGYGGSAGGYGGSTGGYAGGNSGAAGGVSAQLIAAAQAQPSVGSLSGLGLSLPSAGLPNAAIVNVPQHAITSYSAPAVVLQSGAAQGGLYSSSNAAIATSNIRSAGSGYGPAQAGGYGASGSGSYGGSAAY